MLIELNDIIRQHAMHVTGVIHAGAHLGEEAAAYNKACITNVLWIEGNEDLIQPLTDKVHKYGHKVAHALLSDVSGDLRAFHISNNGQSSSLLPLGTHEEVHPEVHYVGDQLHGTQTLDEVVIANGALGWNFLNMDLQGAELLCLKGGRETLRHLDFIYTEVNVDELYQGGALLPQLDSFLSDFDRVQTRMEGASHRGPGWLGWGDAVFIRRG